MLLPLPPWPPFSSRLSNQAPLEPSPSFLHCLPPLPYCGLTKSGLLRFQDDAYLINAWTLQHLFYFCLFSSVAPPPLFPLVFRVRERPDWVCFGDARPFLLYGGRQIHTAEPLILYLTSSAPRMVDPWSIVGGRLYRDIR
jgi:hypothetical protein